MKIKPEFDETGLVNFASWDRLLPHLKDAAGNNDDEEISGLVITEKGISIFFRRK